MTLYLGNDEVSQRINLASVKGTNLPEITEETSGMFLSNDGENIAWSEVETTVDTVLNGWSLFDYKFSDHILEDESWTRSDSFDWKDGTVYKSAYEHLLADYNNSEQKYDYRASNINVIGELTNEKGVLSGFSASNYASINTLTPFNPGSNPWEISLKINLSSDAFFNRGETILSYGDTFPIIHLALTSQGSFIIKLSSNGIDYDIADTATITYALDRNVDIVVKLKFTGSQYSISYSIDNQEFQTDITIDSTQPIFNSDALMYLGCQGSQGNPLPGSIDLNECYIKINGLEWWEGTDSIKYKLSADGHKICDYTQENAIQSVYELNGVAWYYIIDTVNSKFKLPRSKWNFVGLRNEVGAFVDESLPNITGGLENTSISGGSNTGGEWYALGFNQSGALRTESYISNECVAGTSWNNGENLKSITFDASLSSSIYQDNAPVQQRATEMYLYFYVGDVVRNTSIIDITQFGDRMIEVENTVANVESTVEQHIEEVNTTISEYKEEVNTTVANIESSVGDKLDTTQITNCITEIPQDIKLELVDGVLTLKAGSKVYIPNGFEADGTTPKFDEVVVESDITTTQTANGELTVYYLPSQTRMFSFYSVGDISGTTSPKTYGNFYNTTENIIYRYDDSAITYTGLSLPLARITVTDGVISSIDQVFNGFGYIGSTIFALPGVKGLIPNGRNEDGSLKNIETSNDKVLIYTNLHPRNNAILGFSNLYISPQNILTYNELENINLSGGINPAKLVNVATWSADSNNVITSFVPKLPFRAVDYNDMETKANVDLSNIPFLLSKMILIYEGNIEKGNSVTFTQDPETFDMIIAIKDNLILQGKAFSSRIKVCGLWCGVDDESHSGYSQTYAIDFGDKNGTTYKVWFYAWSPTENISYTQMTGNFKIYGIKLFGGI